jgi:hypothetical protein
MSKKTLLFFILTLCFFTQDIHAQFQPKHIRISVLTCAPGQDLYSTFGHSAIRVIDSVDHSDIVYNWGTFDFGDPDFYTKFARGTLLYSLSDAYFKDFMVEYYEEKRSVYEQVLNITDDEKLKIYNAIQVNLSDSNRYYHYLFLYDNCTTRIRDILTNNTDKFHVKTPLFVGKKTFRNLLYEYLDAGGEPWNKLGIDLLLGAKIDKEVNTNTAMFLPEYLMHGIDAAGNNETKIVLQRTKVFDAPANTDISNNYSPLIIFSAITFLIFWLSFTNASWAVKATRVVDSLLFYLTGLLGILFVVMWFCTDHIECADNYNLLWAIPFNFIAAFFIWKRPNWIKKYFRAVAIIQILTILFWAILPQQLNISLIPLVLLLAFRSFKLSTND